MASVTPPQVSAPLAPICEASVFAAQVDPAKLERTPVPVVFRRRPVASPESACSLESVASGVWVM
jgi:hypothetical protein